MINSEYVEAVASCLIEASTTFSEDKIAAYQRAIKNESDETARWVLTQILENAYAAENLRGPLCDDTGIPHLFVEVGNERAIPSCFFSSIQEGIKIGLSRLPGRPMAVMGNDEERLSQSLGISNEAGDLVPAPMIIKNVPGNGLELHILMQGGGPAIRGKTLRIFHKHSAKAVLDELTSWSISAVGQLGCSPCVLAIGIGRSQQEATSLMMEAQIKGRFDKQSSMESYITNNVNESGVGPLGLGGKTSVLSTFMKVGPQRASGVRIACLRPCCCFEPRKASVAFR